MFSLRCSISLRLYIEDYQRNNMKKWNFLYKTICFGILTQVVVIATCVVVYFNPSFAEESERVFRTAAQTCGKLIDSGKERILEWKDSIAERSANHVSTSSKETADLSDRSEPASSDVITSTKPVRTFTPSSKLGVASDLEISDVPEDISSYYIMLDTAMGPMIYYNQGDSRWADHLYGGEDRLSRYGCGPTSISMLISSFSQEGGGLSPVEVADWAAEHGYHASQSGSRHTLIKDALSHYGFTVESVTKYTPETAANLLKSGHVLAALVKKGTFTQSAGHFILITKLLENGNVQIADPNSYKNSQKEWQLELLLSELKTGAQGGGPLWAVSMP